MKINGHYLRERVEAFIDSNPDCRNKRAFEEAAGLPDGTIRQITNKNAAKETTLEKICSVLGQSASDFRVEHSVHSKAALRTDNVIEASQHLLRLMNDGVIDSRCYQNIRSRTNSDSENDGGMCFEKYVLDEVARTPFGENITPIEWKNAIARLHGWKLVIELNDGTRRITRLQSRKEINDIIEVRLATELLFTKSANKEPKAVRESIVNEMRTCLDECKRKHDENNLQYALQIESQWHLACCHDHPTKRRIMAEVMDQALLVGDILMMWAYKPNESSRPQLNITRQIKRMIAELRLLTSAFEEENMTEFEYGLRKHVNHTRENYTKFRNQKRT